MGAIMSELSIHDLETQTGEPLPEREALSIFAFDTVTLVSANNGAEAVQALTALSANHATALQSISIS
jgi:hypothetical protein